jgi:hypothetical protein
VDIINVLKKMFLDIELLNVKTFVHCLKTKNKNEHSINNQKPMKSDPDVKHVFFLIYECHK